MRQRREVGVHYCGETEEQNEPGPLNLALVFFYDGGSQGKRNDPKRASKLYGGADHQARRAVTGGGADHRTGVVNGQSGPQSKLLLRKMERPADPGKYEQSDRIQNKHGAHGNGDFFVAGLDDRSDGSDGAASADGGACGNQKRGGLFDFEDAAEQQAQAHREGDSQRGVKETTAAGAQDFVEVHAKTQSDYG